MQLLETKNGKKYVLKARIDYPFSTNKLDQTLFEVYLGELQDNPEEKFLIKKLLVLSRTEEDHSKFCKEFQKFSNRKHLESILQLVDYVEKDNQIYFIQPYIPTMHRLTTNDQISEVSIVSFIRQITRLYNEFPNNIMNYFSNTDLGFNDLQAFHILYDKENYSLLVDPLNFHCNFKSLVETNPENTHMRSFGELIIQLLFKTSRNKKPLKAFFEEHASKENGIKITNIMKNLITSIFSKDPPSWEKLTMHPLLEPLEGEREAWNIEFVEYIDNTANEAENIPLENDLKYLEIKKYILALDNLNNVRICLMKSDDVIESSVRVLLCLILNSIWLSEEFLNINKKKENCNSNMILKLVHYQSHELKKYYENIFKNEFKEKLENNQTKLFLKFNKMDFDLQNATDNRIEWINILKDDLKDDVLKVFDFLEKEGSLIALDRQLYMELAKV